ncbi:MAG: thioredoxin family protein [Kofleriaceae bacterium]
MRAFALFVLVGCGSTTVAPAAPAHAKAPEKSLQVNAPGELVDIEAQLQPGYVAVVDFWGEHCGACVVVSGMLAVQVALDDRIVIRKVDVGDGFTPVAQHYKIGALPHFRLYDRHKRMRYLLVGNDTLKAPELAKQLADEP